MKIPQKWRGVMILIALLATAWMLYPTVRLATMSPEERAAAPETVEELRSKAINLGLDLQGGIHMVLGVRTEKLRQNILLTQNARVEGLFKERGLAVLDHRVTPDGIEIDLPTAAAERSTDIEELFFALEYFEQPAIVSQPDRITLRASLDAERFAEEVRGATSRALEIIRNRIDAFGVAEPSIQQAGNDRIVVELPGAADPDRARELIGRTAQLQFHRVQEGAALRDALNAMDAVLGEELLKVVSITQSGEFFDVHIEEQNKERFVELISSPAAQEKVPSGARIFLGTLDPNTREISLFLLEEVPAMMGTDLVMARVARDERNRPSVSFEFGSKGAEDFGDLTSELMRGEKRLAVVLDDVVQSAPSVKSRITSRGEITGTFTHEEARDLAVVLRSGSLPAPVEIREERTVGPSLGIDSIRKGSLAAGVAFVIVIIFMFVWYKGAGAIANIALLLNIFIMLAVLATLRATLTLPGIAGIVLTMGMAVDANILIFERIKEELRGGKGLFSAVNAGFDRAFLTIFDANLTTLITAFALMEYGTGPIRGFAVTLSIGIVASMFSAVFVTRWIIDAFILSRPNPKLSL